MTRRVLLVTGAMVLLGRYPTPGPAAPATLAANDAQAADALRFMAFRGHGVGGIHRGADGPHHSPDGPHHGTGRPPHDHHHHGHAHHARQGRADQPPPRNVRGEPVYYAEDGPGGIALTIDDGPSPVYTPQILRLLRRYRIKAAFSMIGVNVAAHPSVARHVTRAGHTIVNHTWSHPDLALLSPGEVQAEIEQASREIHRATGRHPHLFRAPYGAWSPEVMAYCAARRLTPLDWSVDPRDWSRPGVQAITQNIMANTRSGSIILEHDGGGDRSQTVAALRIVLPRLLAQGFRFGRP